MTAKDISICSSSLMGNLDRVATAIPLELKLIKIPADISKIEVVIEAPINEPNGFQKSNFLIYPKINK